MNVLVGLGLGRSHVDPRANARIGAPAWGAPQLLRDLELRLGLPSITEVAGLRIPRWMERIASLRDERAFYARSFASDPLGTAEELLRWRDGLVEAGWDGVPVPGGGDRLGALVALERHEPAGMPPGNADRLLGVERALERHPGSIYASLSRVETAEHWPGRWRRISRERAARGKAPRVGRRAVRRCRAKEHPRASSRLSRPAVAAPHRVSSRPPHGPDQQ